MKERCALLIKKKGNKIGLVIFWSISNHKNINYLVLGREMSNMLEMHLGDQGERIELIP